MKTGRGPGPPKGQMDAAETSAQERVQAGIMELLAVFKTLKGGGAEKDAKAVDEAVSSCDGVLTKLQTNLDGLASEADELRAFGNEALGENERLQKENEDLRKSCEDAQLDQQMMKALNETEKLKSSSETYKKDQLMQQLSDKEEELQRAQDQAASLVADNDALSSRLKRAERDGKAQLEKLQRELAAAKSSISARASGPADAPDSAVSSAASQASSKEMDSLAGLLVAGKQLDQETAAKATKALADLASAQRQLSVTKQENEKLQKEVDELNSTVFSKSFKAPSAWAEREVKYKMEKKAWDEQVKKLKASIQKLKAENEGYRKDNKAAEFEAQLQVARQEIAQANSEKVKAQQDLHEFQIEQMRINEERRHQEVLKQSAPPSPVPPARQKVRDGDDLHGIISGLEQQKIGVQQPKPQTPKQQRRDVRQQMPDTARRIEPLDARTLQSIDALISSYDEHQIEMRAPNALETPSRKPKRAGASGAADASSSSQPTLATSSSTGDLQSLLQGFANGARPLYPFEAQAPSSRSPHRTPRPAREPDARAEPPPDYTPTQLPGDFPEYDSDGEEIIPPKSSAQHAATPSRNQNQAEPDARATPPPDYISTELPGDYPEYDDDGELIVRPKTSQHAASPSKHQGPPDARADTIRGYVDSSSPNTSRSGHPELPSSSAASPNGPKNHAGPLGAGLGSAFGANSREGQGSFSSSDSAEASSGRGHRPDQSGLDAGLGPGGRSGSQSLENGGLHRSGSHTPADADAMSRRDSGASDWNPERVQAVTGADKATIERQLKEHAMENDAEALRFKAAELESRVEMYETQIQKMQKALERADQDQAKLEEELEAAAAPPAASQATAGKPPAGASADKSWWPGRRASRDLDDSNSSLDRLKASEALLQQSYRDRGALEQENTQLQRRLAQMASKLGLGTVNSPLNSAPAAEAAAETPPPAAKDAPAAQGAEPTPAAEGGTAEGTAASGKLAGTPEAQAAQAMAQADRTAPPGPSKAPIPRPAPLSRRLISRNSSFVGGLSEDEIEVMRLREENAALMESLVRAKIELAEAQGDCLQVKRAFIRSAEAATVQKEKAAKALKGARARQATALPDISERATGASPKFSSSQFDVTAFEMPVMDGSPRAPKESTSEKPAPLDRRPSAALS